ncbi:MAG: hypothetical protein ACJA1A_001754 [Saprospiraceae bacterium]|jgi:hypothetical protein|tara:strand:+ start:719 stop:1363 length:645 start_codon:yes stop_codon:yes gene_type:complete
MILLVSIVLLSSCKEDVKPASVITEVYEVDSGANDNYAKGSLKYMEHENFKNGIVTSKTIYNEDQSIKGKEVYTFGDNKKLATGSKFYGPAGELLSTYIYTYEDTLKSYSNAYAGNTDELLRIEGFQYDDKGNMVRKTIFNELKQKQKSFMFGHDQYGNEVKMVLTDQNDKLILTETYEIVTVDDKKRWIEKYGYVNDNPAPATFYHKRRNQDK